MTEAGRLRRPASSFLVVAASLLAIALVAGCGDDGATDAPSVSPGASGRTPAPSVTDAVEALRPVRLRLRGALGTDAAGYVAAIEQGYYEAAGLDVTIEPGDPAAPMPPDPGAPGADAEFLVSWPPAVLVAREREGSDLVDIAQIARRSGTLSIAWTEAGITEPADLADRRMGIIAPGSEPEISAAAIGAGVVPGVDLTMVPIGSSVQAFLAGEVPTAQALIYDGYAQVLEATNPDTDAPYQPTDLDVIPYADLGTAMLQDAIFARAGWLAEDDHEEVATAFLTASFQGWITCRDDPSSCIDWTRDAAEAMAEAATATASPPAGSASPSAAASSSPTTSPAPVPGRGHLAWMLNEYQPLVWPAPDGIGVLDAEAWGETVEVLLDAGLLDAAPGEDAYRTDLALAALEDLASLDTTGAAFEKGSVDITPGGH